MQKDRDYYRACTDAQLIEEALYNVNIELAIVLGERLEAANAELESDNTVWRSEIVLKDDRISELEAQIESLEEQLESHRSEA